MSIQQNTDHIQTTHIGSLPRPHDLLDLMKAKYAGEPYDEARLDALVASSVADCVRRQVECGIEIVSDGEFSKPGFFTYMRDRFDGFEARPDLELQVAKFDKEISAFPEYYAQYFKGAMMGGSLVPVTPLVCNAPVEYKGEAQVAADIANVKAAARAAGIADERVFLPASAPAGIGINAYYKSDEEYFHALAGELAKEYRAIVDAGLLLQVDDPFLSELFGQSALDDAQRKRKAQLYVEATNAALTGIPPERVRFHTCYGINEGPRIHEGDLADSIDYVLQVNAGSVSFEAANPRHEHEYHLFERVEVPEGKVLCPGVVTHASNIVEHPELIAERIVRYARLVGRENVMAGADCGFSSQAMYKTEVHPTVVWEKFKAMRRGADLATRQLWGR
jgi:5-methyltetrahydropteroyltriglutamate--homocysteine methyltransferase